MSWQSLLVVIVVVVVVIVVVVVVVIVIVIIIILVMTVAIIVIIGILRMVMVIIPSATREVCQGKKPTELNSRRADHFVSHYDMVMQTGGGLVPGLPPKLLPNVFRVTRRRPGCAMTFTS